MQDFIMLPFSIRSQFALKSGLNQTQSGMRAMESALADQRREKACRDIKYRLAAARFETAMIRHAFVCRKAGFTEDQPRWPKGTPGTPKPGGRWSGGPGGGTPFINNAVTGISTVDRATDTLGKKLAKVIDILPKGRGPLYGIAVHTAFGWAVRLGNIPGIGFEDVETTWGGVDLPYGSLGSMRTDVVLRNDVGDPIAIYDVKTGGAKLTESRVQELRQAVAPGLRIPVIELHLQRGASLKALGVLANYSVSVVATLNGAVGVR